MQLIRVLFDDQDYDYTTRVNPDTLQSEIEDYFIGQWLNCGHSDNDAMQQCMAVCLLNPDGSTALVLGNQSIGNARGKALEAH